MKKRLAAGQSSHAPFPWPELKHLPFSLFLFRFFRYFSCTFSFSPFAVRQPGRINLSCGQNPLDLEMIEDRILKGAYTDIRDYEKDMLTLFANAISFNIPRSQIVIDARRLRTFFKRVFDKTLPTIAAIFASPTPTLPEADIMEARDMEEEAAAAAVAAKIEKGWRLFFLTPLLPISLRRLTLFLSYILGLTCLMLMFVSQKRSSDAFAKGLVMRVS